ncbi:MAG: hypothetical protein KKC68_07050, partial [Candidatus Thermoplasmatota archaeon]|nr:hypothetical protein [Candidatus Thermoplasmatota archaeon]MBU1941517.1 hypothetical protein [Candidatus Thermoplasmatota archaeon]
MRSTNYSRYSHKLFGDYLRKNQEPERLSRLNLELEKANIPIVSTEYLSKAHLTTLLSIFISLACGILLYFILPDIITLIL